MSEQLHAPGPELMTVEETATYLRCSVATVRRWIATGQLSAARVGGRLLVAREALERIAAAAGAAPLGGNAGANMAIAATPTMDAGAGAPYRAARRAR